MSKLVKKIPKSHPVQPLKPGEAAVALSTCGYCGLSWDDDIVTSMTPAPSARCPFEAFHVYPDDKPARKPRKKAAKKKPVLVAYETFVDPWAEPAPDPMKTILGVSAEYERQYTRNQEEYAAWSKAHPYVPGKPRKEQEHFDGFQIDYTGLGELLVKAIQAEYGYSEARAGAIYGWAYEHGHSSFCDVFSYAGRLADFIKDMPA